MMARDIRTSWTRGRFDGRRGQGKVLFGRMYEDPAIELEVFQPGGRVFCIASAGCTAMALAPRHDVVAVDINPVQLAYAARRFRGGPATPGVAERILALLRTAAILTGWRPSKVRAFLGLSDPAEQTAYWRNNLNTRRFRVAFDTLFRTTALRSIYSPSFLCFLPAPLGPVLRSRMERCFALHANSRNPFARALLLGQISSGRASAEAAQIRLVKADAAAFLEGEPAASFDGFSLSNILDGASPAYTQRLLAAVQHAAAPGAATVVRSFREPAVRSATDRASQDRAMLWGMVEALPVSGFRESWVQNTTQPEPMSPRGEARV